jgi:small subunit ribosomal protein S9|uniref:ribosomal protein S9 n=1 Tax=Prototheca lentecrescens TaxID=2836214 RepID=UPI0030038090
MIKKTYSSVYSGGRKTASALVILNKSNTNTKGNLVVNGKFIADYFNQNKILLHNIFQILKCLKTSSNKLDIKISVKGGGLSAQAQAIRLALCKAVIGIIPQLKKPFKTKGYLTRDARIKERRKYGLKKARRAPQFSKR